MVVGVCRVVLELPGNDSLKGKRKVVRSLLDRVRSRFNAASAEVAAMDDKRRAVLAFCVVSNDSRHANEMADRVADFVTSASQAPVVDRSVQLMQVGD